MKTLCFFTAVVLTFVATAAAQPVIRSTDGVLNGASYKSGIAPGSIFVVFGTGMGPASLVQAASLPFNTDLSGTSVTFTPTGGGAAIQALMVYTSAGQLAALLPSTATPGQYNVTVTYNGQTSAASAVTVVERNFGFVTQASSGSGPAQVTYGGLDLNRFTTGSLAFGGHDWQLRPAHVNDNLVLWGTGAGADAMSDIDGDTSGNQADAGGFMVNIGGIDVKPSYVGRSPGSPGLDQVNVTIPANAPLGCFTTIQVKGNGFESNLGTIAITGPGESACTHPLYTQSELAKLDAGGTLTIGSLSLSKISTKVNITGMGSFDSATESAYGAFAKYSIGTIGDAAFSYTQTGACVIWHRTGNSQEIAQGTLPTPLDAGPQLTLNGPNASNVALTPLQAGSMTYSKTLYSSGFGGFGGSGTPTLTQGTYTITGPGGADIAAFTATTDFPGNFVWTNQDTIADPIPRGSDLLITWTGGSTGIVSINGYAATQTGGDSTNPIFDAAGFYCTAPASAGTFSVPSSVLQQLSAVPNDPTSGNFGSLTVAAAPDYANGQGKFSAQLTNGQPVDYSFFSYSVGSSKPTGYQ